MKKLIVAFILAVGIGGFSMSYIACSKPTTNSNANKNANANTTKATDGGTKATDGGTKKD